MALAVQANPGWRPIGIISLAASGLLVVFLLLPWGNASFLVAIVTVFVRTHSAWRRIPPKPRCALWPMKGGALTAAAV
jgi:hypothetical protein